MRVEVLYGIGLTSENLHELCEIDDEDFYDYDHEIQQIITETNNVRFYYVDFQDKIEFDVLYAIPIQTANISRNTALKCPEVSNDQIESFKLFMNENPKLSEFEPQVLFYISKYD